MCSVEILDRTRRHYMWRERGKKNLTYITELGTCDCEIHGYHGYSNAVAPVMFSAMSGGMSGASQQSKHFFIQNVVVRYLTIMKDR